MYIFTKCTILCYICVCLGDSGWPLSSVHVCIYYGILVHFRDGLDIKTMREMGGGEGEEE